MISEKQGKDKLHKPSSSKGLDRKNKQAVGEAHTERGLERKIEDVEYIPVIIKRSDETLQHLLDAFSFM